MRAVALVAAVSMCAPLVPRVVWAAAPPGEGEPADQAVENDAVTAPASDPDPAVAQGARDPGRSEDPEIERARELADNGRELFRQGSFGAAIEAFEKAYELAADPNLLFNIALSYGRLEQWEMAIEALDRYRAYALPEEREGLEKRRREFQDQLAAQRAAAAEPPEGPHEPSQPSQQSQQSQPDGGRGDGQPVPLVTGLGYGLGAVTLVSLATGITLGSVALARVNAGAGNCAGRDGEQLCNETGGAMREQARGLAIGADVAFAVSAVAATGLLISVVLQARKRKRSSSVALSPGVGPSGAGVSLRGRF